MAYKVLNSITLKIIKNNYPSVATDMLAVLCESKGKKINMPEFLTKSLPELSQPLKVINSGNSKKIIMVSNNSKARLLNISTQPEMSDPTFKWVNFFTALVLDANSNKCKDLSIVLNSTLSRNPKLIEIAARTCESAAYIFNATKNKTKKLNSLRKVTFLLDESNKQHSSILKNHIQVGFAIGEGMNAAKYLGDLPANHCTPRIIETKTRALKKDFPALKISSLTERDLIKLGMGSYMSVAKGSIEPPRMLIIEYKGSNKNDKPAVLVGKGITFDTGGISLKPSGSMDEMKWDMCGAASVFGVIQAIARLKAKVNVVGVMACAENMPSGKATKPGDVVTSMSGQTIEILNTDAEGRLVLCDALTYVKKFKPSFVIDIATLTGACVVALGKHASGLMANDQKLADRVLAAGEVAGDRAWQLPLWEEYQSCTKTNFADLANIGGGREAGTVHAACFLSNFTQEYAWAHLDIAGTAWSTSPKKGATGRPVPLLAEILLK
ncbi:MAG: leucyl aminopeptidase [Gammaproteobacteria bacterium]